MPLVKLPIFTLLSAFAVSFFTLSPAFAAIDKSSSKTAYYYKSPTSQFSSGQATISTLKKNLQSSARFVSEKENDYYQYGQQKISISLLQPTFAKDLSRSTSLKHVYTDIGYFLALASSPLKIEANSTANTLKMIAAGTKLIPLSYKNGFIKTKAGALTGYVDISNTLSKIDFARAVYIQKTPSKKDWVYVKSRIFDRIELIDGNTISFSEVLAIYTQEDLGIISETNNHLPLWSKVYLKKEVETNWRKSSIKGHGIVWWKDNSLPETSDDLVDIDELLKSDVYSVSFAPKNPKKAVASTSLGIFTTTDGESWKKLSFFKENLKVPVLYHSESIVFVGSYRSTDAGKTFEPFINVNTISNSLSKKLGFAPTSLRIKKIQAISPSKIMIEADTGVKKLSLQSSIYNQNWEIK